MNSQRRSEILLAAVIIARSTSYIFSKTCLETMEPFNLLAVRFAIAFVLLLPLLIKRHARVRYTTVLRGAALGLLFFSVMAAEMLALKTTATSVTALLENMAIIFVPFLAALVYKKRPNLAGVISALIAFAGVALLSLKNGAFAISPGMLLCLLAALLYASSIVTTSGFSRKEDPLALGIIQVGFMALFSIVAAFAAGAPRMPQSPVEWGCVAMLTIVSSCFGFTLQPLAQSGTTPERAGLLCALNPAVAALLGRVFMHERLGLAGIFGTLLILASIFASTLLAHMPHLFSKKEKRRSCYK